ncbi:MAG: class I SAM-dependent methyltransferase [Caulobacterales bacterium]|nr:class I SAM-dependent methyltransferase [Caulobacterales bacterium]
MSSALRTVLAATGLLRPAFRLRERMRAWGGPPPPAAAPDGLPLPDRLHMVRVVGHADWRQFYETGLDHAGVYAAIAADAGAPLSEARTVLDWGCGCGRISRHLPRHTSAQVLGRDVDALTVGWSARHLPGDFRVSGFSPPLDLADGAVDGIIAQSVFTHLSRAAQGLWLAELARILRPGGLLLLSFMDEHHHQAHHLGPARADLDAEGFATTTLALEGTNHMATFQTRAQLAASAAPWFREAAARTSGDTSLHQAVLALIRR